MLWLGTTTTVLNVAMWGRLRTIALENSLPFTHSASRCDTGTGWCHPLLSVSAFKCNLKKRHQIREGKEEMCVCGLNNWDGNVPSRKKFGWLMQT